MTKLRIISDIHLEFSKGNMILSELPGDSETVLILAGDVGLGEKTSTYTDFFNEVAPRFQDIIYIMGNHEYYKGSFLRVIPKIKEALHEHINVHVLENESIVIGDTAFICATLWTEFERHNPIVMNEAQHVMNDYKLIRTGPNEKDAYRHKLTASDTYAEFMKSRDYIFNTIPKYKADGKKIVVVTHMLPSWQSVAECYKMDTMNGAYASDLDNYIYDTQPDLMIHGHTHISFDYMIGDTRVVCNPRGYYPHELNPEFNSDLVIEL